MDDAFSPVVAADVFEEGSGVPATLRRLGALVVVEPLSAGDYRISGGALIERKTVADLHGSLGRGRLWSQIGRIRDEAVLPFLFVEGTDIDNGPASQRNPRVPARDRRSGSRSRPFPRSRGHGSMVISARNPPGTTSESVDR